MERGFSRTHLADLCSMNPDSLRGYEAGRTIPGGGALGRLAAALECPIDDFYIRFSFEQVSDAG